MSDSAHTTSAGPPSSSSGASSARLRQTVLAALLLIMLGALWYDYQVARPSVDAAFDRITALNEKINGTGGSRNMTEKDVQEELQRQPIHSYRENNYLVEVYGWRAGLPIKTHNYYAIYQAGPPNIFLTHSKNILDPELVGRVPVQVADYSDTDEPAPVPAGRVPGISGADAAVTSEGALGENSGGKKKGRGKRQGAPPANDSTDPAAAESSLPADPAADAQPADEPADLPPAPAQPADSEKPAKDGEPDQPQESSLKTEKDSGS